MQQYKTAQTWLPERTADIGCKFGGVSGPIMRSRKDAASSEEIKMVREECRQKVTLLIKDILRDPGGRSRRRRWTLAESAEIVLVIGSCIIISP